MNEQQIAKAKELRSKGRSFLSIADEMKLPVKAVYMAIQGLEWSDYYNKEKQVAANKRSAEKKERDMLVHAMLGAKTLLNQGLNKPYLAILDLVEAYEKKRRL